MSSGISIQCSYTSRYFVISSLLYICIVRLAKYVTIIPIAERGERATARLTRRRWIASLRRRDAKDSSFSPRASASETQKMKTARAAHPSIHPIPFSAPRTACGAAKRRSESRTRARAPGRKPRGSLGRAGVRTATTAEAGTSAGWTPLSQSRRRLGGEWT